MKRRHITNTFSSLVERMDRSLLIGQAFVLIGSESASNDSPAKFKYYKDTGSAYHHRYSFSYIMLSYFYIVWLSMCYFYTYFKSGGHVGPSYVHASWTYSVPIVLLFYCAIRSLCEWFPLSRSVVSSLAWLSNVLGPRIKILSDLHNLRYIHYHWTSVLVPNGELLVS